jgi:hypothetical protein
MNHRKTKSGIHCGISNVGACRISNNTINWYYNYYLLYSRRTFAPFRSILFYLLHFLCSRKCEKCETINTITLEQGELKKQV